jgi:hypothetical protein
LDGKCEGNRPFGNHGNRRNGDIKVNFKEIRWGASTGITWLTRWTWEDGNEISGSIKREKFLDKLMYCLLKNNYAPWILLLSWLTFLVMHTSVASNPTPFFDISLTVHHWYQ